jgi:hypothetical protein
MQNKPNFRNDKMNITAYITMRYVNLDAWWEEKTNPIKAKTNPIQTQLLQRAKLMQHVYLQPITKKNAAMGQKKQTQFKPNSNPISKFLVLNFVKLYKILTTYEISF